MLTHAKIIPLANSLKEELQLCINKLDTSEKQMRVFERYITVFHVHFIPWVSAMQNSVVTPVGQYAASDNILLELAEDHQRMLWNFMARVGVEPNVKVYQQLLPAIDKINNILVSSVKTQNGMGSSAVIFFLEETSKVFIPWLENVAVAHGSDELTYTKKHGEADSKHSTLALEAVCAEYQHGEYDAYYKFAFEAVRNLLTLIFSE